MFSTNCIGITGERKERKKGRKKGKKERKRERERKKGRKEGRKANGQRWNNLFNKINKVEEDYKPRYEINIQESIL